MLHHYCWLALCCKIRWSGMDQRYWNCYCHAFNEMSWTDIGVSYFTHANESTQWCMNTSSKLRSSNVVQSNLIFSIDRMLECPLIKVPPLSIYQALKALSFYHGIFVHLAMSINSLAKCYFNLVIHPLDALPIMVVLRLTYVLPYWIDSIVLVSFFY